MRDGVYLYSIDMAVPIGSRRGSLSLDVRSGRISGFLTLFSETLPISEASCPDDEIHFKGEMRTLMYPMRYEASGTVDEKAIKLIFATEKGSFAAEGVAEQKTVKAAKAASKAVKMAKPSGKEANRQI